MLQKEYHIRSGEEDKLKWNTDVVMRKRENSVVR